MPFGHRTTARQVVEGHDLSGRTAIITGGNSGLGTETAKALLSAGAKVIFSSRNLEVGRKVAAELKALQLKGEVEVHQLDLADLSSIQSFAKEVQEEERIDYLILNAGVMACPYGVTKAGFEMQIGTNVFGHYYLVKLLLDKMKSQDFPSRIVVLSSSAHRMGDVDVSDLHYKHGRYYKRWSAYGQSKLANILLAKELDSRLRGTSINVYSLHPGMINTNLMRHNSWMSLPAFLFGWLILKSPEAGAATTVFAAVAPELQDQPGAYLEDCNVTRPSKPAEDAELAKAFYDTMEEQIQEALGQS